MSHHLSVVGLLALVFTLPATSRADAPEPSALGPNTSIQQLRTSGREGDYVTIEGRVVRKWDDEFFDLEDGTGKMTVAIPEYLFREAGEPERNERIKVRGKYDHAYLEPSSTKNDYWGVRVEKLERNRPEPPRKAEEVSNAAKSITPPAPAAQSEMGSATPHASRELVERLSAARRRVEAARKASDEANARWARAMYHKEPEGPDRDAIEQARIRAERELAEARAAVGPLIDEARRSGVSDRLADLVEEDLSE